MSREAPADVFSYLVNGYLLQGALLTVEVAVLAMLCGLLLGFGLALLRMSHRAPLRSFAWGYIWLFRGTPQLLQLVFLYDALPAVGIKFGTFATAVLGFSLNEAAFSAELLRGGIQSVDSRQTAAAAAFGMGPFLTLRRIVLPQAMRAILPGLANDAVSLIKGTSIASVIFLNELTYRSQQIVGENFRFFTVFAAAGLIYLLLTSAVALAQAPLERRFDFSRPRSRGRDAPSFAGRRALSRKDAGALPPTLTNAPPSAAPVLVCRQVWKAYAERPVLRGIDLSVAAGEVVVLMGPSGSGKSTLLRLINHLEPLDRGEITVDGRFVGYERRGETLHPLRRLARARAAARIGIVFQHFNLFEHLTALENVIEAPIRVYGQDPALARERALARLQAVSLQGFEHQMPQQLSGGQQQRVAIARALAIGPRLVMFDEPTSALDPELVGEVLAIIRRLAKTGLTMLIVTHELRFAREVADRIIFMDDGEIIEQGTPEAVLDHPQRDRTQRFLRVVGVQN
jgi:polar amino acid transport system permease protein